VKPLFGYGTFCHPAWRRAILGADYPTRAARLCGWRRVALASGYLSVVPSPGGVVDGVVITLDQTGWRIADAWEEVPRYARVDATAQTESGPLDAVIYVREAEAGAAAFESDRFALLDDDEVERSISAFSREMLALRGTAG
jgi:gamma-glutamylcyclotransferase (GGCT)/AIG2-like uncharacterized protein YtfP